MPDTQDLEEISVRIPSARVPEFYRLVASWRSTEEASAEAPTPPQVAAPSSGEGQWQPGDDAIAQEVWDAGNANARKVYELLIKAAGAPVSGTDLAQAVGMVDGPNQFPGLLGAIGRTTWSRDRDVPWDWDPPKNTYAMKPFIAEMFRKAAGA